MAGLACLSRAVSSGIHTSAGDWIGVILNRIERTITFTKKG